MNLNRIYSEIQYYKLQIEDYENNPQYIELLYEIDNIKKLSYYEKTKLENLDKMNNALIAINISINKLNQKIDNLTYKS